MKHTKQIMIMGLLLISTMLVAACTTQNTQTPTSNPSNSQASNTESTQTSNPSDPQTNSPPPAQGYQAFSSQRLAQTDAETIILFFHASWCPSCRALHNDIEANTDMIPQGMVIFKVDYDDESELKKTYGVTTQHTLVQVDKEGNMITKWSGGSTLEQVVTKAQ